MTKPIEELERRVQELEDRIAHKCRTCTCPDFTVPTQRLVRLKMRIQRVIDDPELSKTVTIDRIGKLLEEDSDAYGE